MTRAVPIHRVVSSGSFLSARVAHGQKTYGYASLKPLTFVRGRVRVHGPHLQKERSTSGAERKQYLRG